jgi:1-deoxy-D-xylulose-5-phosphate synthase
MNEAEMRNMMYTAQAKDLGPFAFRYPRGKGVMPEWKTKMKEVRIGKGRKLRSGEDIGILTIGHPGNFAQEACEELAEEGIDAAHYDLRFVKPLDEMMLQELFQKFDRVITVEDGCIEGGMGSAVLEFMNDHGYQAQVERLGIPDRVIEHGDPPEHQADCGFDKDGIVKKVKEILGTEEESASYRKVRG